MTGAVTPGSVVVGYCDGGTWSASFGLSYRDLVMHDVLGPQRIVRAGGTELRKVVGTMGVAPGRNDIAAQFLDGTDGEWLWMVDTDMGFAPDTVDQLVKAADAELRPVLGGLCFALKRQERGDLYAERFRMAPTVYEYLDLGDEVGFRPILDYPRGQVVQVAATGAACLLMHRSALAKVRGRYGDAWFDPIVHPTGAKGRPRTFSEDLSFCVRLASVDLPIHVDTGVRTSHHKGGVFLDEAAYDHQQSAPWPTSPDAAAGP
ncbi:hypothetical protein [Micromonospora aurantiaca (nom. illeg.)]|uniref:hypothetical protein n=1 Tax=Micromonospora aurantiaca (nom. illeg.) TaxID=47850 RepID=UPI003F4A37B5